MELTIAVVEFMLMVVVKSNLSTSFLSPLWAAKCNSVLPCGALGMKMKLYSHKLAVRKSYWLSFTYSCAGFVFGWASSIGQDWTWLENCRNSPCHWHPLSTWRQNTWRTFTFSWSSLFSSAFHSLARHSGHVFLSFCNLLAAPWERFCWQQDVRWGCSITSYVTGQYNSWGGSLTNGYSGGTGLQGWKWTH